MARDSGDESPQVARAPPAKKQKRGISEEKRAFYAGPEPTKWANARMSLNDLIGLCEAWRRDPKRTQKGAPWLSITVPANTLQFLTNYNEEYFKTKQKIDATHPGSLNIHIPDEVLAQGGLDDDALAEAAANGGY